MLKGKKKLRLISHNNLPLVLLFEIPSTERRTEKWSLEDDMKNFERSKILSKVTSHSIGEGVYDLILKKKNNNKKK